MGAANVIFVGRLAKNLVDHNFVAADVCIAAGGTRAITWFIPERFGRNKTVDFEFEVAAEELGEGSEDETKDHRGDKVKTD